MGNVKLLKHAKPEDIDKKAPTPLGNGEVFHNIVRGKAVDGVGWTGTKTELADVRIFFTDTSSIIIGYAPDGCPGITFVPGWTK
jgi:hypothetical protein